LIGGAVGDALGYAVEFMSLEQIRQKYGAYGITEYELTDGVAMISDDTQMTLFTANGLLLGTTRGHVRGIMGSYESYVACCYRDWLKTQDGAYHSHVAENTGERRNYSWLIGVPELHRQRAPGNTCLTALRTGVPVERSKGCGGVMRVAPVGLYFDMKDISITRNEVAAIGGEVAAITHGHDLGYIPAAALAYIINAIMYGDYTGEDDLANIVSDCLEDMKAIYHEKPHIDDFTQIVEEAIMLAKSDKTDDEAIAALGEGWVAEETLAIALFCALRYKDDFEKAIIASVNHSGDSDSTGSVTGNILGAYHGYDRLPRKFVDRLELKNVILEIADDLWHDCRLPDPYDEWSEEDEVWHAKYI
jgi:ADP-ribosylglycohydrolase